MKKKLPLRTETLKHLRPIHLAAVAAAAGCGYTATCNIDSYGHVACELK
jgi:hypothetical protein